MISLFLLVGCNLSYIVDLFAALHELASASLSACKKSENFEITNFLFSQSRSHMKTRIFFSDR